MPPQLQCNSSSKSKAALTFLKAVRILAQNWTSNLFETLYLGILHHREKQAGLSTAHNGGIIHHLSATSPEATRKNNHEHEQAYKLKLRYK